MKRTMKELLMVGVVAVVLAICSAANAAGIGDNLEPLGNGKISVSLTENTIFDRDYEPSGDTTKVNLDEMNETYAKVAFGLGETTNLYTILGRLNSAELNQEGLTTVIFSETFTVDATSNYKYESDAGFLWGLGINDTHTLENGYFIGTDLHYLRYEADIDKISGSADIYSFTGTDIKGDYEYQEVQGTAYIGKRFETSPEIFCIPYLGIFLNYSKIKVSDVNFTTAEEILGTKWIYTGSSGDIENENNFGMMLGTNVEISKSFALNLESRFISEQALTISGTYKF